MKINRAFGIIMMIAAIALMTFIMFNEVDAITAMQNSYKELSQSEISEEEVSLIFYDDKMIVSLAFGSTDSLVSMDEFLNQSIKEIDIRVLTSGIVYSAVIATMTSCFWAFFYDEEKKKHIIAVCLCGLAVYLIFCAAVIGTMKAAGLPVFMPSGEYPVALLMGLMAVLAGNCAFALRLRKTNSKAIITVIALIVVFGTYLFGSLCEGGLFTEPTLESFDYLAEIDEHIFDEDYDGELVKDEEKNVVVVNGTEYPPEKVPNPDHFTGIKRAGAIAFEVINPYSPITLPLLMHATEISVPTAALVLYIIKSALWILCPLIRKKGK